MSTSLLAAERAVTGQVMLYGRRALALLDIAPGDMHHPVCAVTVGAEGAVRVEFLHCPFRELAEAYPDLKASANFLQFQGELSNTENEIQMSSPPASTPAISCSEPRSAIRQRSCRHSAASRPGGSSKRQGRASR